jgi:periplasmic protein TonB
MSVSYSSYQPSASRLIGIGFVVLFHAVIIYALVTGLAKRAVNVVRQPIETTIITEAAPERKEPLPPPPPQFRPPPLPFVPPPEIHIETRPPQSTAPTVVTTVTPPAPPEPAAPVAATPEPARVTPKIDASHSREPEYPPAARRLGLQGSVILEVLIDVDGRVRESKLVQSSGYDVLDQAALAGVKDNYRFVPGTVDGKPQQMWYTFKFNWKLIR